MKYIFLLIVSLLPITCSASVDYLKFVHELDRDTDPFTLEAYLESRDVFTLHRDKIAGHVTDAQKFQMNEILASHSSIKNIGEIGLNAGHSADNFFNNCKQLEKFVSFDIEYIPEVVGYFSTKHKDRFLFVKGDSLKTVPEFAARFPNIKFDLIFIDGAHSYGACLHDIVNMKLLAHSETHLWIDDYRHPDVFEAVETCKNVHGILEVIKVHSSDRRTPCERCWIEARYLFF